MTRQKADQTGKVADVVDEYAIILNRGSNHGVEVGEIWAILDPEPVKVEDPDTGESLGDRHEEKLRVRITKVDERFSTGETYRRYTVGSDIMATLSGISSLGGGGRRVVRERVKSDSIKFQRAPLVVTVNIGDPAELLFPAGEEEQEE